MPIRQALRGGAGTHDHHRPGGEVEGHRSHWPRSCNRGIDRFDRCFWRSVLFTGSRYGQVRVPLLTAKPFQSHTLANRRGCCRLRITVTAVQGSSTCWNILLRHQGLRDFGRNIANGEVCHASTLFLRSLTTLLEWTGMRQSRRCKCSNSQFGSIGADERRLARNLVRNGVCGRGAAQPWRQGGGISRSLVRGGGPHRRRSD